MHDLNYFEEFLPCYSRIELKELRDLLDQELADRNKHDRISLLKNTTDSLRSQLRDAKSCNSILLKEIGTLQRLVDRLNDAIACYQLDAIEVPADSMEEDLLTFF